MSKNTKEIMARLAAETKAAQAQRETDASSRKVAEDAQAQKNRNAMEAAKAFFVQSIEPLRSAMNDFNEVNIRDAHAGVYGVGERDRGVLKYDGEFYGVNVEFSLQTYMSIQFATSDGTTDIWRLGFATLFNGSPDKLIVASCYTRQSTHEQGVNDFFDPASEPGAAQWAERQIDAMLAHVKLD